jgi:RNA recognition motif-containing protein
MDVKLFVGQVPSSCDEVDLRQLFSQFGHVQDVFILRDRATQRPKGAAFVTMADAAAADAAIQSLDNRHALPPQTQPLQVRVAENKGPGQGPGPRHSAAPSRHSAAAGRPQRNSHGRKLFVSQFPRDYREEDLGDLMRPYGTVEESVVLRDRETQEGRGAGFVIFSGASACERAIQALDGQLVLPNMRRPLQVRYADGEVPPPAGDPKLFVGMVTREATEEDIHNVFAPFGHIEDIFLIKKDGQATGACFVKYDSLEACDAAIQELDGRHTFPGANRPVNVKYAAAAGSRGRRGEPEPHPAPVYDHPHQYPPVRAIAPAAASSRGPGRYVEEAAAAAPTEEPKLFVGMITREATEHDVYDVFAPFGHVTDIHLLQKEGQNSGACFVKFTTFDACDAAIRELNGRHTFPGASRPVTVKFATGAGGGGSGSGGGGRSGGGRRPDPDSGRLTVRQPAPTHEVAQPYPSMAYPAPSPLSAPLAQLAGLPQLDLAQQIMQLQHLQQMQLQQLQQLQVLQQQLLSQPIALAGQPLLQTQPPPPPPPAGRASAGPPGATLYVNHLPAEYTDDHLVQLFQPFGTLLNASVSRDRHTSQSRGFGFVGFLNPGDAQAAIASLNGAQVGPHRLLVQVKTDRPRPY